jgi:hypothetical protein
MTRTLIPARTPAPAAAIALVVALACAGLPSTVHADVQIPLDSAISPQYQVPETPASVDVVDDVVPAVDAVQAAPAPDAVAPAPEPLAPEPQYHPENADGNSEDLLEKAATPSEPAAITPPPNDPPAADPATAADAREVPVPGPSAPPLPDTAVDLPQIELPALDAEPEVAEAPAPAPAPTHAPAAPAGNINVSVRVFSPGDTGPVTQISGGGSTSGGGAVSTPTSAAPVPAPSTWIWNWTWNGAPACAPDGGANAAPSAGVANWVWNWTWACGPGSGSVPLPDLDPTANIGTGIGSLPGMAALPDVGSAALVLPAIVPLPLASPGEPDGRGPTGPDAADVPPRSPRSSARHRRGGASFTTPPAPRAVELTGAPGLAALVPPDAHEPAAERVAARRRGRDIARPLAAIPLQTGPDGVGVAVAAGAGAGGAGGPAVLTILICLLISFLASTLLDAAGLPRLLLRDARLERPG